MRSRFQEKGIVAAILAGGVFARLVWSLMGQSLTPVTDESHNIAVSLARFGLFADPNADGSGPSAHVGMLTPLPSAFAYHLFGIDTPIAEFMLSLWATALVAASIWLCWRLAEALNVPPPARIAATALAALVPLQFGLEVRDGRSWEVNLAVALLLLILLRLVRQDRQTEIARRDLAMTGAVAGFLFIVNPPAGLAATVALALFSVLRLSVARWWIAPAAFILVVGLLGGVWAERNMRALGAPVALRDNLGLELDLSNYDGAVHPSDPRAEYVARQDEIHPHMLKAGAERMRRAGGELSYYNQLDREAWRWITLHPGEFLSLSVRHVMEFFLPPRWFWSTFEAEGKLVELRWLLVWVTTITGLITLAVMGWKHRPYVYLLAATLTAALPYAMVQPTLRYRYLVSSLLIFLACDGTVRLMRYSKMRQERRRDTSIQAAEG